MKISKLFLFATIALAATACTGDDPGVSTKVPTGSTQEPETPKDDEQPNDNVVSPMPEFSCNTFATAVDAQKTYQTMEGFGASDCWLPNQIGQYWLSDRLQLARWLFSKSVVNGQPQGIGLSMWRVNLGAGTAEIGEAGGIDADNANNRAESYFNGSVYDWNKCVGQRYFMEQAKNNGCESFVLFSNSPLVQWTKNGQGRSDSGANANLKDDCYDDFAEYMVTVAQHFSQQGYNITHISPVNEPQYNWDGKNQEGSGWKNSEVARLAKELDKSIASRNLSTKILLGEAGSWDHLYSGNASDRSNVIDAFFSSSSSSYVGDLKNVDKCIGGHSYWTFDNWNDMRKVRKQVGSKANGKNVRVWQTEWSMLDACPSELGGDYDKISEFDIAAYMSKIIHLDIVDANCSSWSYWTSMSVERWGQKNRFELIKTTPAGGNYDNNFKVNGSVQATHNLWVLGNYSLFVRPGFKRIEYNLNGKESKDFFGTAYISPEGNQIVVVVSNFNKERGVMLDNTFAGVGTPKSIYRYTTTSTKHLKEDRFNVADKVFVEPYSISTIVYNF